MQCVCVHYSRLQLINLSWFVWNILMHLDLHLCINNRKTIKQCSTICDAAFLPAKLLPCWMLLLPCWYRSLQTPHLQKGTQSLSEDGLSLLKYPWYGLGTWRIFCIQQRVYWIQISHIRNHFTLIIVVLYSHFVHFYCFSSVTVYSYKPWNSHIW